MIEHMSCRGVRRRLSAYHDGELATHAQVVVEAHLRDCPRCARSVSGFLAVGEILRARAARDSAGRAIGLEALGAEVIGRVKAEREEAMTAQVARMFEDMRLGFAALGSTAASVVSMALVVGIFTFGPQTQRPDSLSGVIQTMGTAGSVDVRDLVGRDIVEPTSHDREAMSVSTMFGRSPSGAEVGEGELSEQDAVFTLAAMVTRQGRIASLEVAKSDPGSGADREQVLRLLDQVSRARLEPAKVGGAPVASRKLWVLAHTTVRGKLPVQPKQSRLPGALPRQILI